ncbi:hypothetical protein DEJ45_30135 [Streptomyces venezuelae]|uniref:hypothetical protein n=1 Tax=Streptomyces venezuelae TaxID=54571 RepID=UPI00123DEC6C|nr:hypothetical protein [Streptomyces venezuelae]QES16219.1 hypothetical protein DEJ45_30135 [Streptomyces venezuelae]
MHKDHLRFAAARGLLAPFFPRTTPGVPVDRAAREAALEAPLRFLWDRSERGGLTVYEAAAEMRALAGALAAGGEAAARIPDDLRELASRSGAGGEPAVLLDIAAYVDGWQAGMNPKLAAAVPTTWELAQRFPLLSGMLDLYFGQDGIALEEEVSDVDGIGLYVTYWHERGTCPWRLPPVVAECAEALALFQDDDTLRRFFADDLGLGSGSHRSWSAWLTLISDTLTTHLRREHGPVTWTGGREEQPSC